MNIKIVIVDDDIYNAESIHDSINSFKSIYPDKEINYTVIEVFDGIFAYQNALKFIKANQNEIDIILADYQLTRGLGIDLLKQISKGYRIYRVIHSETDISFLKLKDDYKLFVDYFIYSKEDDSIHKALKIYERDILNIMLFGNKEFQSSYYINDTKLNFVAGKPIKGLNILPAEIMFIHSLGEEKFIIYYCDNKTGMIDSRIGWKITINNFQTDDFENYLFKRVHKQTIINLLWVSNFNIFQEEIEFIPSIKNMAFKRKFNFSDLFKEEVLPHLSDINKLPDFFRR